MKYICQCIKGADHLTFEIGGGGGGWAILKINFLPIKKIPAAKNQNILHWGEGGKDERGEGWRGKKFVLKR